MPNTYTTTQGDAWDSIAYKLWGEERLAHKLMQANPQHMDVLIFPAGVTLLVPHAEKKQKTFFLPPWAAQDRGQS